MHIYLQCLCLLGRFFLEYFWVSLYGPFFKSISSDMSIATPAFFPCPFAWNICYQPFTLSLCRSFVLRRVSCRQHMCGSGFVIHSAILCLLIGAFNPFMFKVIIDRYLFIAYFLFLCCSLSLSFPSFPYSSPFSISCRAGLVEEYSFRLLLSGKLLICPSVLIESRAG